MNIDQKLAIRAQAWVTNDLMRLFKTAVFKPDYKDCLERLQNFETWVSEHETGSELAGILTGVHNCRQRHLLDSLMPSPFYCSVTEKPDKKFVKNLITMYYDAVVHFMKCL